MYQQAQIDRIAAKAQELATHSWEYGAISHALTEIYDPPLSPFFGDVNDYDSIDEEKVRHARGVQYAKKHIRTDQDTLADGEGVSSDPASLGTAAILLGKSDKEYAQAVGRQRDILVLKTPRLENGAISHRVSVAEAWSDFTYMGPPFLAFEAFISRDINRFEEVVQQCELQREVLQDEKNGLWIHVVGPDKPDPGYWGTGHGWAVCGLTRVYALVQKLKSGKAGQVSKTLEDKLERSIISMIDAAVKTDADTNGLLRTYLDDKTYPGDNAGTAAITSAVFRMAVIKPSLISDSVIEWAQKMVKVVVSCVEDDGIVAPVANPYRSRERQPIHGSAEGQAFVLHLIAAHRDWLQAQRSEDRSEPCR